MIIRMIRKDILINKKKMLIILFCISFAVALFFASTSIINTVMSSYRENSKIFSGNSDIIINSQPYTKNLFFEKKKLSGQIVNDIEYEIESPIVNGIFEKEKNYYQILVRGLSIEEIKQMMMMNLNIDNRNAFEGNNIIISSGFAKTNNYKIGDTIKLEIGNQNFDFVVYGIISGKNVFSEKAYDNQVIIPKNQINQIFNMDNKTNYIFIKIKDTSKIDKIVEGLSSLYTDQNVKPSFSQYEFNEKMQGVFIIFIITSFVITIMSFIIVYNAFSIIMNERFRTFGILRSIGATKVFINKMVFFEGIIYGFCGGCLGSLIGILITYISGYVLKPESIINVVFEIDIKKIIISILFSMVTCGLVMLSAVRKIKKVSIKNLFLNFIKYKLRKERKIIIFLSFIVFILNIVAVFIVPSNAPMIFIVFCILVTIVTTISILPRIIRGIIHILRKPYQTLFGNCGYISLKNVKGDNNFYNNIILMTVSIGVILMINSALNSIVNQNMNTFKNNYICDFIINTQQNDEEVTLLTSQIKGVKDYYEQISMQNVQIKNKDNYSIYTVDGIDGEKYLNFRNFDVDDSIAKNINDDRYIIISDTLKNKLNIKVDDKLILKLNNSEVEYKVKGFFNTSINNGNYALISNKFLLSDFDISKYSELYVKVDGEINTQKEKIKDTLKKYNPKVQTVNEVVDELFEASKATFTTIKIISWLPIIIGIIIIMSNSIVNFYERKRYIAIFRAIGMDKKNVIKMMLLEQLTSGVIGGVTGISFGNLLIFQIKTFLRTIYNTMPITYSRLLTVSTFFIVIIINLVPFLFISMRGFNFNIAKEIRNSV